jgi:hypothetical protein
LALSRTLHAAGKTANFQDIPANTAKVYISHPHPGLGITSHYPPYTEWAQCAINSQQALGNPRDSLHRIRNVPFGSGSTPTTNTRAEKHTDADTLFDNNNIRCRTESALLPTPIAHKNRRGTFRENNTAKIAAEPLFSHRLFVV